MKKKLKNEVNPTTNFFKSKEIELQIKMKLPHFLLFMQYFININKMLQLLDTIPMPATSFSLPIAQSGSTGPQRENQ